MTRGRLFVLVVLTLVAVFAFAGTAQASTIAAKNFRVQPKGTVGTGVPVIVSGSGTFDGYPLDPASCVLTVDGAVVPRSAYVATFASGRNLYLYWVPAPALADGLRTVSVSVADTAGKQSSVSWSFTVAQKPTGTFTAPDAATPNYDGRPVIGLAVSDNTPGPGLAVTGQVHAGDATGEVVATFGGAGLSGGQQVFTLPGELVPGPYTLTADVTDAAGLAFAVPARHFEVVSAEPMSVFTAECTGCHESTGHPATGIPCAECHLSVYHNYADCGDCHEPHAGPVTVSSSCRSCHDKEGAPKHTKDSVAPAHLSACDGCHNESLLERHAGRASATFANQCDFCHESTNARVQAAIASGDASCSACHDASEHGDLQAIHTSTITSGRVQVMTLHMARSPETAQVDCASCHASKNLLTLHGSGWNNCAMCHDAGGARSSFEVWNKGCQQGSCHTPNLHDNSKSEPAHQAVADWYARRCDWCHKSGPLDYYAPLECNVMCHQSPMPLKGDSVAPTTSVTNARAYFTDPAEIHLSATDAGSGVVGIYYRLDGPWTYVTDSSASVIVPFGGSGVLEYYAVDFLGNVESPKTYTITFDTHAPVTSVRNVATNPPNYPWYLDVIETESGLAHTYYSVDGGPLIEYGYFTRIEGIRTDNGGGPHSISYYSVDVAGNIEETQTFNWVIPDTSPPTSRLQRPDGWAATVAPSLTISSTDDYNNSPCGVKAIYYRLDGGDWVVTTFPREQMYFGLPREVAVVTPGDGTYTLDYYAVDHANSAETMLSATITIDTGGPSLAVDAVDSYIQSGTITASGTDTGSGVASVTYAIAGYGSTTVDGASATFSLPNVLWGSRTYELTVVATDQAGNMSATFTKSILVTAPPDTVKPGSYAYYPITSSMVIYNGNTYSRADGTMVIKLQAWDNSGVVSRIWYKIDGGEWQYGANWDLNITVSGFGAHTLSYYAVDAAGNEQVPVTVGFTINP